MQPSKWDLILEQKPIPLLSHLLEEVAKIFAKDLATWPPHVEDFDPVTGRKLADLLAEAPLAPDPRLYVEAFVLTRFDLARELAASDDYLRNQRWMASGLGAKDRGMLLFLSRFMAEQLLGLAEATEGRVTRKHLLDVLDRTERLFFARGPPT
ncbi:MAG: hypothetical protein Q8L48_07300 [Archangium sp.]|nr:hypothetical protein [Archangium sp.]